MPRAAFALRNVSSYPVVGDSVDVSMPRAAFALRNSKQKQEKLREAFAGFNAASGICPAQLKMKLVLLR